MKSELTRRKILGGVASLGILGAGVTAQTGLDGASISGSADVQAEQALTINDVRVAGNDPDGDFTRVSDDNTEYGVAVELNNGDGFRIDHEITNSSDSELPIQFNIKCSDDLTVDMKSGQAGGSAINNGDEPIKSGNNTFITDISGGDATTVVDLSIELADTADPGAYDVSVAINPLSGGDSR